MSSNVDTTIMQKTATNGATNPDSSSHIRKRTCVAGSVTKKKAREKEDHMTLRSR